MGILINDDYTLTSKTIIYLHQESKQEEGDEAQENKPHLALFCFGSLTKGFSM